ncbi:MAG: aquaporin family protein [Rhizobiales bacterium]|nr:aquaporin family protein [Hyphomicrobiales bacterium]
MSDRPYDLSRRLAAEVIGTAFLLATVVGSGIMAENLAGGNVAIALLGNTIPTGAILVVLILMFGPVSGAHFNPAVTLSFVVQGQLRTGDAIAYAIAQVVGGLLGAWSAHLMFEQPLLMLSLTERTGTGQWAGEIIATFGLVATIIACVRHRADAVPFAVGLYITAAYWFTSSTSFANPAVTIARSFTDTFSGIRPVDAPVFIFCQIVGALLATWIFAWLLSPARSAVPGAASSAAE